MTDPTTIRAALPAETVKAYALAGNATLTLQSERTGTRFTFKLEGSDDGAIHFVKLLTGADNESDFEYLGTIRADRFAHGKKSRIGRDSVSAVAFAWAWPHIAAGRIPPTLAVYHEGRCGRCNRKLTVPESIRTGFGPECAGRIARAA
jgi:hypothetical protein